MHFVNNFLRFRFTLRYSFCTFSQCFLLAALWLLYSSCSLLFSSWAAAVGFFARKLHNRRESFAAWNAICFDFHTRDFCCTVAISLYIYRNNYIAGSFNSILDFSVSPVSLCMFAPCVAESKCCRLLTSCWTLPALRGHEFFMNPY